MQQRETQLMKTWPNVLLTAALLLWISGASAEVPTVLTDTIKSGTGDIDLLKDVTTTELNDVLSSGSLYLGVDLNESSAAPESADAQGVAIKDVELIITTTEGTFSFSSFYTNTTATLLEQGADTADEFYTLFGQTGSNDLTSSTSGFDLSTFDDVLVLEGISFTGEILSAQLNITLLNTAKNTGVNETFFDYSAGFEDLAILNQTDAQTLESANIGVDAVSDAITFTQTATDLAAPSGAPEPHWLLLAAVPGLLMSRMKRKR
jgi:hypothetical protein